MVQEGAGRGFDQLRPHHSAVIHPQGFPPTRRTLGSRRCDCPLAPTCNRGDAAVDDTVDASGVGVGIFFKDGLFGRAKGRLSTGQLWLGFVDIPTVGTAAVASLHSVGHLQKN